LATLTLTELEVEAQMEELKLEEELLQLVNKLVAIIIEILKNIMRSRVLTTLLLLSRTNLENSSKN
jgi:hypothetical protein